MSDVWEQDVDFKAVLFGSNTPWKQSSVSSSLSEPASQIDGRGKKEAGLNMKSISTCFFRFPFTSGTRCEQLRSKFLSGVTMNIPGCSKSKGASGKATLDDIPVCCSPDAAKNSEGVCQIWTLRNVKIRTAEFHQFCDSKPDVGTRRPSTRRTRVINCL